MMQTRLMVIKASCRVYCCEW